MLERDKLTRPSTLFIDDTPGHLDVARTLGMQVHHFTTAKALLRDLETLGLA